MLSRNTQAWRGGGNAVVTPVRKSLMISFLLVVLAAACGDTTGPLSDAQAGMPATMTTSSSTAPNSAAKSRPTYSRPNQNGSQDLNGPDGIQMVKHSSNYAVAF